MEESSGAGESLTSPNDSSDSSFADSVLLSSSDGGPAYSTPPTEQDDAITMDKTVTLAAPRPKVLLLGEIEM